MLRRILVSLALLLCGAPARAQTVYPPITRRFSWARTRTVRLEMFLSHLRSILFGPSDR